MKRLLFLFGLLIGLSACQSRASSTTPPSSTSNDTPAMQQFITDIDTHVQNFSATVTTADAAALDELPQVIQQLQTIQTEVQNLEPPSQAIQTQAALYSYMDSKIQCYFKRPVPKDVTPMSSGERKDLCSLSASKLSYFQQQFSELKQSTTSVKQ